MTTTNTKQIILDAARPMVQAHGYNALSFRDVASAIGIKSASIHYHFPTKGDLGAALAKNYTESGRAYLAELEAASPHLSDRLTGFIDIFRSALVNENRMCLVGIMAAEHHDLPVEVRAEVGRFTDVCVEWLSDILPPPAGGADAQAARDQALAIFTAVQGAQLVARGKNDIALFDHIIATYRRNGLIP